MCHSSSFIDIVDSRELGVRLGSKGFMGKVDFKNGFERKA